MALRQPTQSQILIPLLSEIHQAGGVARPGELYDRIAARLNLDDATRYDMVDAGKAGRVSAFERRVRWTRQSAVMHELIEKGDRGVWSLTDRANAKLQNIVRGTIVTIFETDRGVMLWANAEDAISVVEKNSCQLVFTSPEYPLVKQKIYGNRSSAKWVDWMLRLCEGWRELLTPTGSIMLNVGPTWLPGKPQASLHVERLLIALEDQLGLSLCQNLMWNSPNRLGALEWVGIRRVRVRSTVESIIWVAPDPSRAYANNRNVLTPYSKSMQRAIDNPHDGTKQRPSGYTRWEGGVCGTGISATAAMWQIWRHKSRDAPEIPTLPHTKATAIAVAVEGPIRLGSSAAAVAFVRILEELEQRRPVTAPGTSQDRRTA